MSDKNIIKLDNGYVPDPQIVKSKEWIEIQSQLTFLADEVMLLSKAVQALVVGLKNQARNNK